MKRFIVAGALAALLVSVSTSAPAADVGAGLKAAPQSAVQFASELAALTGAALERDVVLALAVDFGPAPFAAVALAAEKPTAVSSPPGDRAGADLFISQTTLVAARTPRAVRSSG